MKTPRNTIAVAAARALPAVAAWILPAAGALAQQSEAAPPTPTTPENPPLWIYYLLMLVLVGASVMISIMPSKRGHQD